jgi:UDP-4-amino-4,6-dideoxy-N-acetyl-beta-L-altrosamine transaminase
MENQTIKTTTTEFSLLPYGRHLIEEDDIEAVVDVLRGDWLTQGPVVEQFETALATRVGARHAVVCSSGTAALHLAAMAMGIGPDSSVIVPANTFLATANAARLCGAEIIFADVDPDSGLMTAAHAATALRQAGKDRARAVLPVHFAGQCSAMEDYRALADEHDLTIIEDACHALGTSYDVDGEEHAIGACAHSDMATFSFHPVKTIAMGEGGAVTTNDDQLAVRLRDLRNHGMSREPDRYTRDELAFDASGSPQPWYYEMHEPGLNYRSSGLHCALGLSQLGKLDRFVNRRRELVEHYDRRIATLEPIVRGLARTANCRPAWHLYVALIDFAAPGIERAEFMRALREKGIGTQVHYIPVPWQPYYAERAGKLDLPGAAAYYARCLSLPLFSTMDEDDVDRVVDAIADILETAG